MKLNNKALIFLTIVLLINTTIKPVNRILNKTGQEIRLFFSPRSISSIKLMSDNILNLTGSEEEIRYIKSGKSLILKEFDPLKNNDYILIKKSNNSYSLVPIENIDNLKKLTDDDLQKLNNNLNKKSKTEQIKINKPKIKNNKKPKITTSELCEVLFKGLTTISILTLIVLYYKNNNDCSDCAI